MFGVTPGVIGKTIDFFNIPKAAVGIAGAGYAGYTTLNPTVPKTQRLESGILLGIAAGSVANQFFSGKYISEEDREAAVRALEEGAKTKTIEIAPNANNKIIKALADSVQMDLPDSEITAKKLTSTRIYMTNVVDPTTGEVTKYAYVEAGKLIGGTTELNGARTWLGYRIEDGEVAGNLGRISITGVEDVKDTLTRISAKAVITYNEDPDFIQRLLQQPGKEKAIGMDITDVVQSKQGFVYNNPTEKPITLSLVKTVDGDENVIRLNIPAKSVANIDLGKAIITNVKEISPKDIVENLFTKTEQFRPDVFNKNILSGGWYTDTQGIRIYTPTDISINLDKVSYAIKGTEPAGLISSIQKNYLVPFTKSISTGGPLFGFEPSTIEEETAAKSISAAEGASIPKTVSPDVYTKGEQIIDYMKSYTGQALPKSYYEGLSTIVKGIEGGIYQSVPTTPSSSLIGATSIKAMILTLPPAISYPNLLLGTGALTSGLINLPKEKLNLIPGLKTNLKTYETQFIAPLSNQVNKQIQVQTNIQKETNVLTQAPSQVQIPVQVQIPTQIQIQPQVQKTALELTPALTPSTAIVGIPYVTPTPLIAGGFLLLPPPSTKKEQKIEKKVKPGKGFAVEIRRKRKFVEAAPFAFPTKEAAVAYGATRVLGEAAATFRVIPSAKPITTAAPAAVNVGEYFRAPKTKALRGPDTYVQLERKRITSPGEKREISLQGVLARTGRIPPTTFTKIPSRNTSKFVFTPKRTTSKRPTSFIKSKSSKVSKSNRTFF